MKRQLRILYVAAGIGAMAACAGRAADAPRDLALNGGFEEVDYSGEEMPASWTEYSSAERVCELAQDKFRGGVRAAKLMTQKARGACACLYQIVDVAPGGRYKFAVNVSNSDTDPLSGTAYGVAVIEWWNDAGDELSRIESKKWNLALAADAWQPYTVEGVAPKGATTGHFAIYVCDGNARGGGAFYVDDVSIATTAGNGSASPQQAGQSVRTALK